MSASGRRERSGGFVTVRASACRQLPRRSYEPQTQLATISMYMIDVRTSRPQCDGHTGTSTLQPAINASQGALRDSGDGGATSDNKNETIQYVFIVNCEKCLRGRRFACRAAHSRSVAVGGTAEQDPVYPHIMHVRALGT